MVGDVALLIHRWFQFALSSNVLTRSTVESIGQHLWSVDLVGKTETRPKKKYENVIKTI
jgi:hypothetical protein